MVNVETINENVTVKTIDGKTMNLQEDLNKVGEYLNQDGCVILEKAAKLGPFEPLFEERLALEINEVEERSGIINFDSKTIECVTTGLLKYAIGLIVFNDQRRDIRLGAYILRVLTPNDKVKRLEPGPYSIECIHLGGNDDTFNMEIEIEGVMKPLNARSGDIIICRYDRMRTKLRTDSERAFVTENYYIPLDPHTEGLIPKFVDHYVKLGNGSVEKQQDHAIWSYKEFTNRNKVTYVNRDS